MFHHVFRFMPNGISRMPFCCNPRASVRPFFILLGNIFYISKKYISRTFKQCCTVIQSIWRCLSCRRIIKIRIVFIIPYNHHTGIFSCFGNYRSLGTYLIKNTVKTAASQVNHGSGISQAILKLFLFPVGCTYDFRYILYIQLHLLSSYFHVPIRTAGHG